MSLPTASPPWRRALRAAMLLPFVLALTNAARAQKSPAVTLFEDRCGACHTIGGGDQAGPDLVAVAQWPDGKLHEAIERMEDNAGEMNDDEVKLLVAFLKSPDVKQQLAGGTTAATAVPEAPPPPPAYPDNGRKLFFGEAQFANGGSPCFACHAVSGRGGNLARDLTSAGALIGNVRLTAAATKPLFPAMKANYTTRPLTPQEALDVVAFLEQPSAAGAVTDRIDIVHGGAAAAALVIMAAVALLAGSRRGFRSRLTRHSRR